MGLYKSQRPMYPCMVANLYPFHQSKMTSVHMTSNASTLVLLWDVHRIYTWNLIYKITSSKFNCAVLYKFENNPLYS